MGAVASVVILLSLTGCGDGDGLPVRVESLRERLPELEAAAIQWRADAYLVDATVEILGGDSTNQWLISGAFQSPSEDAHSILLLLEQDGSITSEVVQHPIGVEQVEPITLIVVVVRVRSVIPDGHRSGLARWLRRRCPPESAGPFSTMWCATSPGFG